MTVMSKNIVHFDLEALDFESAVDEVDILVPKYLEALEKLEAADSFAEIPSRLQNVVVYWERLTLLFQQLQPLENEVPFGEIMSNSLQSELATLEKVYLRINLRIEFVESKWTRSLWKAAELVLERMDIVLAGLSFAEDHEDRLLIAELQTKNSDKYQKWLMSNKVLKRVAE